MSQEPFPTIIARVLMAAPWPGPDTQQPPRRDVVYVCVLMRDGSYRCGKCGKGVIQPDPTVANFCDVCRAVVVEVQREPDMARIKSHRWLMGPDTLDW